MNGRVYDPQIGRFLSADPFVQAPENSQSFNRYSYVMNNPLSLVDPSGYFAVLSPVDIPGNYDFDIAPILGNTNMLDIDRVLWQSQIDHQYGTDLLGRYDTGAVFTDFEQNNWHHAIEAEFNNNKDFRDNWVQDNTQVFQQESLPIAPAPSYPRPMGSE